MSCESCAQVGQHAAGCPELDKLEAKRRIVELDQLDELIDARQIRPLIRKLGATILRRIADKIEGSGL